MFAEIENSEITRSRDPIGHGRVILISHAWVLNQSPSSPQMLGLKNKRKKGNILKYCDGCIKLSWWSSMMKKSVFLTAMSGLIILRMPQWGSGMTAGKTGLQNFRLRQKFSTQVIYRRFQESGSSSSGVNNSAG